MNANVPHILEPYIRQCIHKPNLTLLTSVLDTPTNWLLVRFLNAALSRIGPEDASGGISDGRPSVNSCNVVFVSIWRSFELWAELAGKCRLNLYNGIANGKLCYVNGLGGSASSLPVSSSSTAPMPTTAMVDIKSLTLQELNIAVTAALQKSSPLGVKENVVVMFDGLDFLLACQPALQSVELAHFVTNIKHQTHAVVATCAADSALLHNSDAAAATPLELEHSVFVRTLAHRACFVYQLRPLETGHSREVSGTVRVSRGGGYDHAGDGAEELDEGEWLYHVKSDGTVGVWERGRIR